MVWPNNACRLSSIHKRPGWWRIDLGQAVGHASARARGADAAFGGLRARSRRALVRWRMVAARNKLVGLLQVDEGVDVKQASADFLDLRAFRTDIEVFDACFLVAVGACTEKTPRVIDVEIDAQIEPV